MINILENGEIDVKKLDKSELEFIVELRLRYYASFLKQKTGDEE